MSSEPIREPIEPPGGFEQTPLPRDPENRPEWLVGADDNTDFDRPRGLPPALSRPGGNLEDEEAPPPPERSRPTFRLMQAPAAQEPLAAQEPEEPSSPSGWSAAASSVPRLTVSSRGGRLRRDEEEDEAEGSASLPEGDRSDADAAEQGSEVAEPSVELPHEPWWLVAVETLATNRPIQIGIAAVLVAVAAWVFWPRKENQTVAIAAIKTHPERFQEQPVRVRGVVGEVWDVGSGVVFYLHQRRDTMVVFSTTRRPSPRERLLILGTVSTGYLDGTPRVALFESATAAAPR
jgi:hypothetical protein